MADPTIPSFSTRLWSDEVGMMADTDTPVPGYVFSNGRSFAQTRYDPPVPDPVFPE